MVFLKIASLFLFTIYCFRGCPLKLPNIQGVKIDLFDLYETVTSLGGWQKVNSTEKWNEVLLKLSFDPTIQNSDYALRLIYMRYLG